MATVLVTPTAQTEYDELPAAIKMRVEGIFIRLRDWPQVSGAKPLRGELAGKYRLRTGDYRVQFSVVGDVPAVEKIGHRDGFYEG